MKDVDIDVGTIDGGLTTEGPGFGKPDPLAYLSLALCNLVSLHLVPFVYFLMHWGQLHFFLLWVG